MENNDIEFEEYLINTKNNLVEKITKWFPHEVPQPHLPEGMRSEIRTSTEDMILAFDQLRARYSKTIKQKTNG